MITGLENGGAEAVLYRMVTEDKENRHSVVSLQGRGYYGRLLEEKGVEAIYLNMPKGKITLSGLFKCYRFLRISSADIVQTWMYHADLVGGILAYVAGNKNVIWGIHNTNLDPDKTSWQTRLVVKINAILSEILPRIIISCSFCGREEHVKRGYPLSKFSVVPNGYNLKDFRRLPSAREEVRRSLGISDDIFLLGMVARFDPQKDHQNLISALKSFSMNTTSNWKCLLIGSGMTNENELLHHWIEQAELGGKIIMLGQQKEITNYMNALDVHVLSSSGEAFPNVLCEAMACETPVITTNVGDAAMIVGEKGWVVHPKNPQALASAMLDAKVTYHDSEKWNSLKRSSRERIQNHFSLSKMILNYSQVWKTLL